MPFALHPVEGLERPAAPTPQLVRPIGGGQRNCAAAGRLLIAGTPVRDLLFCAKLLYAAAMVAGCGMTWLSEGGSWSGKAHR